MTEVEKLNARLKEMGAVKFSVFPGTNETVTNEQVAKQINDSLDRLLTGELQEIDMDKEPDNKHD